MNKKSLLLFVVCCLNGLLVHLKAETITYDFSSTGYWVTESKGTTHPGTGTSAQIKEIYYTENNDCFVGNGDVYFDNGYLMLKYGASLKIPYNPDWTVNKVILHSHSGGSTSVKVNIYDSHDGFSVSTVLTWGKDADHEYAISEGKRQSPLYIKVSNKNNNARITSVTVDYTSAGGGDSDGSNEDNPEGDDENDKEEEIVVSAPIFNPTSTSFSTESLTVAMDAAEGCEIYYTKDGSIPSYTDSENYVGTRGNSVTIYASESKVTLKAIAVNPITGKCSNVSSATYTYVEVKNDGKTKEKAYTVSELRTMPYSTTVKDKWVKGTICGVVDTNDNLVTSNITIESNIAIGDENGFIAVELEKDSKIKMREGVNLKSNPNMLGKELLVQGNLEQYLIPFVGVKDPTEYEVFYNVPINSYGYATLCLDMPVSVPDGATAYYCTLENNYAELYPVGSIIPSNMGVIIESAPNTTSTFTYTTNSNSNEGSILEENLLVGFPRETIVEADGYAYYALNVKDNKLGFYIPQTAANPEDAASGFTAKAYKAYLKVPAEQKANMFIIHREGDEAAIAPVAHISDDTVYDLQGRIVVSPISGLYIKNGKKIVVK